MPWIEHNEPTPEQLKAADRAHTALCHELNLMAREGIGMHELLSGIGAATADLIASTAGPEHVAPWFERQAQLVRELQRGGN